jgi:hypothetical protein
MSRYWAWGSVADEPGGGTHPAATAPRPLLPVADDPSSTEAFLLACPALNPLSVARLAALGGPVSELMARVCGGGGPALAPDLPSQAWGLLAAHWQAAPLPGAAGDCCGATGPALEQCWGREAAQPELFQRVQQASGLFQQGAAAAAGVTLAQHAELSGVPDLVRQEQWQPSQHSHQPQQLRCNLLQEPHWRQRQRCGLGGGLEEEAGQLGWSMEEPGAPLEAQRGSEPPRQQEDGGGWRPEGGHGYGGGERYLDGAEACDDLFELDNRQCDGVYGGLGRSCGQSAQPQAVLGQRRIGPLAPPEEGGFEGLGGGRVVLMPAGQDEGPTAGFDPQELLDDFLSRRGHGGGGGGGSATSLGRTRTHGVVAAARPGPLPQQQHVDRPWQSQARSGAATPAATADRRRADGFGGRLAAGRYGEEWVGRPAALLQGQQDEEDGAWGLLPPTKRQRRQRNNGGSMYGGGAGGGLFDAFCEDATGRGGEGGFDRAPALLPGPPASAMRRGRPGGGGDCATGLGARPPGRDGSELDGGGLRGLRATAAWEDTAEERALSFGDGAYGSMDEAADEDAFPGRGSFPGLFGDGRGGSRRAAGPLGGGALLAEWDVEEAEEGPSGGACADQRGLSVPAASDLPGGRSHDWLHRRPAASGLAVRHGAGSWGDVRAAGVGGGRSSRRGGAVSGHGGLAAGGPRLTAPAFMAHRNPKRQLGYEFAPSSSGPGDMFGDGGGARKRGGQQTRLAWK